MPHFVGRVTVKGLLEKDGRVLITRNGRWELPGGSLEVGEELKSALAREFRPRDSAATHLDCGRDVSNHGVWPWDEYLAMVKEELVAL